MDGRDGAVARQGHADGLGQAVHGIGRVHARAGTAGGTGVLLQLVKLLVVDRAGGMAAHRLKHLGQAHPHTPVLAGQHRPAADKNGRQVHPAGGQQHAGHNFVTVGDEHHRVHRMGGEHHLDGIGDQFARAQRVFHAGMVHGQAVAHADSVKGKRDAAGVADAVLHRTGDGVQVDVNKAIFRADHRHKGAFLFVFGDAQRV